MYTLCAFCTLLLHFAGAEELVRGTPSRAQEFRRLVDDSVQLQPIVPSSPALPNAPLQMLTPTTQAPSLSNTTIQLVTLDDPAQATSTRAQEFRRLVDNGGQPQPPITPTTAMPATVISSSTTPLSIPASPPPVVTNATVQILRARSKHFRCKDSSECNGGMCNTMSGRCFCPPGFTGESCAINIDECRQTNEPCLNNGICIDEIDSFRCECTAGYKGDRCQESVDMCVGSPCLNGAKCINHRIDYSCECEPGWEGKTCDKNINECLNNPCQNNGTCYDEINDYRCDCGPSGFTGKNCDVDFDDCAAKPCGLGAKECIDLTGDFKCVCHDGFTGKRCNIDIEECQTNPCENNGTCIEKSLNVRYLHNLTTDLTPIYHEFREQNMTNGLNMSQYAGYICECKEEYYGDRCEEKKKCYTKSIMELCNHKEAECINVGSSYECLINASFDGSGMNYANYRIDGDVKMREIYVKYKSTTGGIIMSFGTTQPDSPLADLLLNKSGVYLSGAPIKRDENMNFDSYLDGSERDFRLELDTPLEIKSITIARQNSLNDYHLPFKGCLKQVRVNNQLVPLVDYGFNMSSFELADNHLEVGQCVTCFEKDCLNGGYCKFNDPHSKTDHCDCSLNKAFTGEFCEIDVNECDRNFNICGINAVSCENTHGGYRCTCKEGYRGEKCQEISDYCKAKTPCTHDGTCKNLNLAHISAIPFQCDCPSGYIGKRCEQPRTCFNECSNHHGRCINNVTCACLPGRREERIMCEHVSCEQVQGDLCLNGGTCRDRENGEYYCVCQEPFFGPICQYILQKPHFDIMFMIFVVCVVLIVSCCAVAFLFIFRSVRKARATRGTYSPSTQEKFGNAASDLLKPPQPERLI